MTPLDSLPALLGGPPVRPQGPPDWPFPDEEVRSALDNAYADGSWGKYHGHYVDQLAVQLARYLDVPHVLLCGSGTYAVELALRALRVVAGDEVILSAYDYPGNFYAVHAIGATPVLVDVDPANWNLAPERLDAAVSAATRVILASHLHGGVVPMREVMEIAARHGLKVLEDAAQMPGATVQGRRAGTWGDVGVWSFGGSKLLTAGRGGALFTRHADVQQRARMNALRGNHVCPLSELQAAVVLPQLARLDERNASRTRRVRQLVQSLAGLGGLSPFVNVCDETEPGYYKLGFRYDADAFGLPRARFVAALRAEGIAFDEGFAGLHVGRSPNRLRKASDLREAERAHHGTVILHHPVLLGSERDVEEVAVAVRKIAHHASDLEKQR